MPKKDNNYYVETNALFVVLVAYCYYQMNKDEQHNNVYNYPINTSINWTPITLSSLMLLLTSTTSLILALNPERSNFHESKAQKYLEAGFKVAEGMLPLANKYGFKIAKIIGGDRVDAAQDIAEQGLTVVEQGFRFLTTLELIHAHQTARSFIIPANTEANIEEARYLSRTAYNTHLIDEAFILLTESAVTLVWNSGAYRILNQYLHIDEKDTVASLNALYLVADLIKFIGTKTINNLSLATEIVIYGEDKSQYHKIEEPEIIQAIKSFAHEILEGIRRVKQEIIELKNQLEKKAEEIAEKLLEITHFKEISEAATQVKEEIAHQLKEAQGNLIELGTQFKAKAQEVEEKILEATHLKEAKAKLDYELGKLNHYFGSQIAELEKSATILQAQWHGFQARKKPEVKALLDKKKISIEKSKSTEEDHEDTNLPVDQEQPTSTAHMTVITMLIDELDVSISPVTAAPVVSPKKEDHHSDSKVEAKEGKHHSSFGEFFHHPLTSMGSAFHITGAHHSSSTSAPKDAKKDAGKVSASGGDSKQQGSSSGTQAKIDKADINEKSINSGGSYISLVTQKIAEFSFASPLTMASSKTKTSAPKNEEREEYNQAKQEAEKNANNIASVNYENLPMLEKPTNKTQTTYYKAGQELVDVMITLESGGIPMFGEEGGYHNQNIGIAM